MSHGRRISVIGLGYVGLPVAVAFGRGGESVVAMDIDTERVRELRDGHDRTGEVSSDEAPIWHWIMVWLPQPAMPAAKSQYTPHAPHPPR